MASSGTYAFSPSNANIVLDAFGRIRIPPTEFVAEHMLYAYRQFNLALVKFANQEPNLWTSESQELTLTAGTPTYDLPARTVMVQIAYLRTNPDEEDQVDKVLFPCSTVEYASYPNKLQQGPPTTYWFNRQIIPAVSFYPCPDTDDQIVKLQCLRQIQDANLPNGETPEVPYRWLDALEAELAYRLAKRFAPDLEDKRKVDATEAWAIAATQDTENVSLIIAPMMSGYRG